MAGVVEKSDLVTLYETNAHLPKPDGMKDSEPKPEASTATNNSSSAGSSRRLSYPLREQYAIGSLDCKIVKNCEGVPDAVAVFFHGFGSNNDDMASLQPMIDSPDMPCMWYVFPNAPMSGVGGSSNGRAWFELNIAQIGINLLTSPQRLHGDTLDGMTKIRAVLKTWFKDLVKESGVPMSKTIVGGFSQGSFVALDIAYHHEECPAGVIVLSGALTGGTELAKKIPKRKHMMVLQSHGTSDMVLPYGLTGSKLRDFLRNQGVTVHFTKFEGPHTVPEEMFPKMRKFVKHAITTLD
eukprot:TRINITY_DN33611_c0_g1_i1.p1 TRINITY_DN33611_c0_g1~~TRINITY_DN33611_c0_g1_i1.p1  ORF type:complete len:330 (-),score=31.16 TRINITY_DN33611_c0_g1_i1:113-997(-)